MEEIVGREGGKGEEGKEKQASLYLYNYIMGNNKNYYKLIY